MLSAPEGLIGEKDNVVRAISILVAMAVSAGPALAAPGEASARTRGRGIAQTYCARCHSIARHGISHNPKAPAFRNLVTKFPLDDLQEALAEGISVGHQGLEMPEFRFAPTQIEDLLDYLRSLRPR